MNASQEFVKLVRSGYESLYWILMEALDQAQAGKGAERHNLGGDLPFERQRMQQISELIGSVDGMTYQAVKKITEGVNLPTLDRQVAELLGAINYIAGMITFLRKHPQIAEQRHRLDEQRVIAMARQYLTPEGVAKLEDAFLNDVADA